MKVKIEFELDLEGLVEENKDNILLKGKSKDEIYNELKIIFGDDLDKGMSEDVKREYKNNFEEIFNY
jgi:hypothetical protein